MIFNIDVQSFIFVKIGTELKIFSPVLTFNCIKMLSLKLRLFAKNQLPGVNPINKFESRVITLF